MALTNSSFNLSKTTKKLASGISDPQTRRKFLDMMIQAEHAQAVGKNRKFSDPAMSQKGGNRPQQTTTDTAAE
jgi:hypothetical protein